MSIKLRLLLTGLLLVFEGGLYRFINASTTLISGEMAGKQLQNSDSAYIGNVVGQHMLAGIPGLLSLAVLAALIAIWWTPAKKFFGGGATTAILAAVFGLCAFGQAEPAHAYYSKENWPEVVMILPNESAFFVPDNGANKDSQTKMDSESYYNDNKIAQKLFTVPHRKWEGSGTFSDYWVPAGKLIKVDRTPYSRQWVDAHDRGTSKLKEGFVCQSKEGLNITAGIAIGASVTPENAAKFLYNFGILPPPGTMNKDGTPNVEQQSKPEVIFTSVYYGKSLTQVMDDFGRIMVHSLVCDEISKRTFDDANANMVTMMDSIKKNTISYFSGVGITINFMGWGDTFNFEEPIQKAVNSKYIAEQDRVNAAALAPYAETIKAVALADLIRRSTWNGNTPTTVMGMDPSVMGMVGAILSTPSGTIGRPGPTPANAAALPPKQ